jgi:hypothetical protein
MALGEVKSFLRTPATHCSPAPTATAPCNRKKESVLRIRDILGRIRIRGKVFFFIFFS